VSAPVHTPVLLEAFLSATRPGPGQRWIDGTFGRGGHTRALLAAGAEVLGLDRDEAAAEAAEAVGREWPGKFRWIRRNFAELEECGREAGWEEIDGVLLDLGVSSPQLDTAERGFSFRLDGPLDMRMDRREGVTAAQLVNEATEEELAKIFYEYGDEKHGRRIARAITARRQRRPFVATQDFAEVVAGAVGRTRAKRIHPATAVFQALRIAVNREREALLAALPQATRIMKAEGTLAVISFHSGEDRVVKGYMREHAAQWLDTPEHPQSFRNPQCYFSRVERFLPTEEEMERNPRARSARLRVARRNEVPYVQL
jgi:16S rRNA (cytosine1402-N4)-methyltransferase